MSGVSTGIITGERRKITNAKAQAKRKAEMQAAGFVQCNVWVPADTATDLKQMAEVLRKAHEDGNDLAIGPCRRKSNNRLVSWRKYKGVGDE